MSDRRAKTLVPSPDDPQVGAMQRQRAERDDERDEEGAGTAATTLDVRACHVVLPWDTQADYHARSER